MKLVAVTVQRFRNFVEPQRVDIEDDVTVLIGKNESGKTTILKALHRLNPANGDGQRFDLVTEYPRWRLTRDRKTQELEELAPVEAEFELSDSDRATLAVTLPAPLPASAIVIASRTYNNTLYVMLKAELPDVIAAAADAASINADDVAELSAAESIDAAIARAKEMQKEHKESDPPRAKVLGSFSAQAESRRFLVESFRLEPDGRDAIKSLLPTFFYFSNYSVLPGGTDLTELAGKIDAGEAQSESERTVLSLLSHAGVKPKDFLDANYDSRKAELQAASTDLSSEVFKYWTVNKDLKVIFDTDNVKFGQTNQGNVVNHRILKIELRDARHGDVETNFSTRSTGFQWFFSFFAAFSEYQNSDANVIVLLDEPGTSLHGEAQKDFVNYIFNELGASKQTIYTTHSQFMIDPTVYEKLRAVHDKATRDDNEAGVEVSRVNLKADPDTVLPVESALGYSISQHLFIGSGQHLLVEGSSDFIYLMRMSAFMEASKKPILSPKLAIIPVGGITNMPAFVALMGRRLNVSVLVDGEKSAAVLDRTRNAAKQNGVPSSRVISVGEVDQSLPKDGDIEDLFSVGDYLKLYNWAFKKTLTEADLDGTTGRVIARISTFEGTKFNHALPAHALTDRQGEFFEDLDPVSVDNFAKLFGLLNAGVV
ncbi:AAA family ATPase [Conyzicola sp.]|uniref:AAA family ATPase n=1 Tax=Conyzicola sp. TaxID=1969404 RepID=UPI00398A087A